MFGGSIWSNHANPWEVGPVPGGIPCQEGQTIRERMRADEEVRERRTAFPATLPVGRECARGEPGGFVRERESPDPCASQGTIEILFPGEAHAELRIDDRVDRDHAPLGGAGQRLG